MNGNEHKFHKILCQAKSDTQDSTYWARFMKTEAIVQKNTGNKHTNMVWQTHSREKNIL